MKARFFAIATAAVLCAASLSSCTEEKISPVEKPATWPKVITVSFERPVLANETRAVMGEDGHTPMWEEYAYSSGNYTGDKLSVFTLDDNGDQMHCYYKCTDPSKGEFTFDESFGWVNDIGNPVKEPQGPYVVAFCGDQLPSITMDNNEIFISGNPEPSQKPGDISGAMMVCYTDDLNDVSMKNIMSLFKFTVPENKKIIYVSLDVYHMNSTLYDYTQSEYTWYYHNDNFFDWISLGYPYYDPAIGPDDAVSLVPGDYYIPFIPQDLTLYDFPLTLFYMDTPVTMQNNGLSGFAKELLGCELTVEPGKIYDLGVIGEGFEPKAMN